MYPLYVGVNTLIQVYTLYCICICRKQVGHCHDKIDRVSYFYTTKGPFSHSRSHIIIDMRWLVVDCRCSELLSFPTFFIFCLYMVGNGKLYQLKFHHNVYYTGNAHNYIHRFEKLFPS